MSKQEQIKEVAPLLSEAITHQRRIRELVRKIEEILVERINDPESLAYERITNYINAVAYEDEIIQIVGEDESENDLFHAKELVQRTSR